MTKAITITVVVFLSISTAAVPTNASALTGRGLIAFVNGSIIDDAEIWLMEEDGTDQHRLALGRVGIQRNPAWSPDGTKLVFSANFDDEFNWEIYAANADGSGLTRLTTTTNFSYDIEPAWSPDGTRIAFISSRDGVDLYVMDSDGTDVARWTTTNFEYVEDPVWSPDGTKIVIEADGSLYSVSAPGGQLTRLSPSSAADDGDPAFSPDGNSIVFSRDDFGQGGLWVMNADGTNRQQLTPGGSNWDTDPAFSPDGSILLFTRNFSGYEENVMMATVSNTHNLTRLVSSDMAEPAWQPCGGGGACRPAGSLALSSIDLDRVARTNTRIRVVGHQFPDHSPYEIVVSLYRRTEGRFRKLASKAASLSNNAGFVASFPRPKAGICRVKARFPGDSDHLGSSVSSATFRC